MNILIVIPLFNERKHILKLVQDLLRYQLTIVIVDDGSTDGSMSVLESLRNKKNIVILKHGVNLGKGASMKTGAEYAFTHGADAVVFMDSDGQHKTKDLPKILKKISSQKYDVVFGSRNFGMSVPLVRYLGNKLASIFVTLLFNIYVSDLLCGYRAITKSAYKIIKWESAGYGVETEMVARVGLNHLRFCEVTVESVYLNSVKGVTLLDAVGILGQVIKWRLTF